MVLHHPVISHKQRMDVNLEGEDVEWMVQNFSLRPAEERLIR